MKRSQALGLLFIGLMLVAAAPSLPTKASPAYSESLDVSVAGSSALWFLTFQGFNVTSRVTTAEEVQGVSSYNLTAIKTSGWHADDLIFGPMGYDLLPVPFIPPTGIFLTVSADSFASAKASASSFDHWLFTAFNSYSNGTTYVFYSPFSFDTLVPTTLFAQVPKSQHGFADAITSSAFMGTASPIITLQGKKVGSAFEHTIVLGSIATAALDDSLKPKIAALFGESVTSLLPSDKSTSSTVKIHFLDGVVNSTDAQATFSNDYATFSGEYSKSLPHGSNLTSLDVSVAQIPAQLLAYRTVNTGILHTGDNLSVTIWLSDLSNTTQINDIHLSDDWWKATHDFELVRDTSTISLDTLDKGARSTPGYVLRYNGTTPGRVTMPADPVSYSFTVGGTTFHAKAYLNTVPISLGLDDPLVYAFAAPKSGFSKPVGTPQDLKLVVRNVGGSAANTVVAANQSISGLGSGASTTLLLQFSPADLLSTNITRTYDVTYKDLNGAPYSSVSNRVGAVFSHSSMAIGLAVVNVVQVIKPMAGGLVNYTITYSVSNKGTANLHDFSAYQQLPPGLGCGSANKTGFSCGYSPANCTPLGLCTLRNATVHLSYTDVAPTQPKTVSMKYNLSSQFNYFLAPMTFHAMSSGYNLTGKSNALGSPLGLVITKTFTQPDMFPGMTSSVKVVAVNGGPFNLFNSTFTTTADSVDTLTGTAPSTQRTPSLDPGANATFTYAVKAGVSRSNVTSSSVTATFFFAGLPFSTFAAGPEITVYEPVYASITTVPANVIEGSPFSLNVTVTNPSPVAVTGVQLSLPISSGLGVTPLQGSVFAGGVLNFLPGDMGPHQSKSTAVQIQANSGVVISFQAGSFVFSYSGQSAHGKLPSEGIVVGENVTLRYMVPTGLALLALLGTAFYLRRISGVSARPSPS